MNAPLINKFFNTLLYYITNSMASGYIRLFLLYSVIA